MANRRHRTETPAREPEVGEPEVGGPKIGDPDNIGALNELANEARERGENDRAFALFQRALAIDPGDGATHNNLGILLACLDRFAEAEQEYRAAMAADPNLAAGYANLGRILCIQEKAIPEAEAVLRRALDMDRSQPASWHWLAAALRRLGRPAEAVTALAQSLTLKDDSRAHYQMGLALKALGRPAQAAESFRRALDMDPSRVFAAAALANLEVAGPAPAALDGNAKRVVIHINQRFHYAFLRPLFEAMAARHHALFTADMCEAVAFDPEVVIVSDAQARVLRARLPRARFVQTRHGLISKRHADDVARDADYLCVSSAAVRDGYIQRGAEPRRGFWVTGYVQMDPLFRAPPLAEPQDAPLATPLPAAPRAAPGRKTVLYAPTFNPMLSSAPMLGADIAPLIRGRRDDLFLIIKPHPLIGETQPQWMAWWRAAAERGPDIHLVADPAADLIPYLKAADLLISDASSASFLYLALDRPIVQITNPKAHGDGARFDPDGIEWRWRDMGEEVHDPAQLAGAVARALDGPDRFAARRAHYRELLFGGLTDGHACARIADHIAALDL